jgi:hypothetical protein
LVVVLPVAAAVAVVVAVVSPAALAAHPSGRCAAAAAVSQFVHLAHQPGLSAERRGRYEKDEMQFISKEALSHPKTVVWKAGE